MVRLNQKYSSKPPARKQAMATAQRSVRLCLDHGHFWLGERAGMLGGERSPRAILVVLVRESNAEGQRREPATRSVRIATRRAGWRPFAGPSGWASYLLLHSQWVSAAKGCPKCPDKSR